MNAQDLKKFAEYEENYSLFFGKPFDVTAFKENIVNEVKVLQSEKTEISFQEWSSWDEDDKIIQRELANCNSLAAVMLRLNMLIRSKYVSFSDETIELFKQQINKAEVIVHRCKIR